MLPWKDEEEECSRGDSAPLLAWAPDRKPLGSSPSGLKKMEPRL